LFGPIGFRTFGRLPAVAPVTRDPVCSGAGLFGSSGSGVVTRSRGARPATGHLSDPGGGLFGFFGSSIWNRSPRVGRGGVGMATP
jgi:hypothetical protein